MTTSARAQPKPEKRATTKRRKARKESMRAKIIRAKCVIRDGYCRVGKDADDYTDCCGPSEWGHFGAMKRARTRGQAPEIRHTTAGSFMACRSHHADYDAGELAITAASDAGCDGELVYARPSF